MIDRASLLRGYRGWLAYGMATLFVIGVAAIRTALDPIVGSEVPLLPFILAVLSASLAGGLRTGLYATGLSTVLAQWLFVHPHGPTALSDPGEALRCAIFVLAGTLMSSVVEMLRQARLDAIRANDEKDALIAMLAHEFRNPINAVHTAIGVMKSRQSEERRTWARDLIERQATVMGRLVDDLLDTARIRREAFTGLQLQPTAVQAILEGAIASIQPLMEERRLRFEADIATSARVLADPIRLQQALANLLGNACRYTPHEGCVTVAVAVSARVHVTIRDTGIGISSDRLHRLFEPFQRGPQSTGLGLGLFLAHTFVQYSGGTLEAASGGDGAGSTFVVTLPVWEDAQETEGIRISQRMPLPH